MALPRRGEKKKVELQATSTSKTFRKRRKPNGVQESKEAIEVTKLTSEHKTAPRERGRALRMPVDANTNLQLETPPRLKHATTPEARLLTVLGAKLSLACETMREREKRDKEQGKRNTHKVKTLAHEKKLAKLHRSPEDRPVQQSPDVATGTTTHAKRAQRRAGRADQMAKGAGASAIFAGEAMKDAQASAVTARAAKRKARKAAASGRKAADSARNTVSKQMQRTGLPADPNIAHKEALEYARQLAEERAVKNGNVT